MAHKGITLRGLRKLKALCEKLCAAGRFREDRVINGVLFNGVYDFCMLTTTQLVYMSVVDRKPQIEGEGEGAALRRAMKRLGHLLWGVKLDCGPAHWSACLLI